MEDLYKVLLGYESVPARDLAYRLEKFIKGSAAGIFNQQSNFDLTNGLTIFSIRSLEEELRPVAMHIILDFVWTKIKKTLKKRLLILDEGWYMMKYEDSASFVYSIAKRARKYYLGMTTATQDVEDFLKTEYGKAVLTNSSIQILLKQGTAEVDMIAQTFYLSEGEKALLLSADVGEGLFFAGQNHVAMKAFAAPFEHELITSNPMEILKKQQAQQAMSITHGPTATPTPTGPAPAFQSPTPSAAFHSAPVSVTPTAPLLPTTPPTIPTSPPTTPPASINPVESTQATPPLSSPILPKP
jgi:type IV secretory pathway VirB4 component